jgi:hypothetical protein
MPATPGTGAQISLPGPGPLDLSPNTAISHPGVAAAIEVERPVILILQAVNRSSTT